MPQIHPHAEAVYRVIPLDDGKFAVEVTIPGTNPTKVIGLESQETADAWIERHKTQIATGTILRQSAWSRGGRR
jgi:hypothetical protein